MILSEISLLLPGEAFSEFNAILSENRELKKELCTTKHFMLSLSLLFLLRRPKYSCVVLHIKCILFIYNNCPSNKYFMHIDWTQQ